MMRYRAHIAVLHAVTLCLLLLDPAPASAGEPSFDCNKASSDDEIAICGSDQLSELDNLTAAGFQFLRLKLGRKEANRIARPMLKLRRACGGDVECIRSRQVEAVEAYRQLGAPLSLPGEMKASAPARVTAGDGMPIAIGACSDSTIEFIGGRVGDDDTFESGVAVGYRNGGGQVSYDRVPEILQSKVGDPVRICLVSIPSNCPPGDDRGRVYNTTNLRTGGIWETSDSAHNCGGA